MNGHDSKVRVSLMPLVGLSILAFGLGACEDTREANVPPPTIERFPEEASLDEGHNGRAGNEERDIVDVDWLDIEKLDEQLNALQAKFIAWYPNEWEIIQHVFSGKGPNFNPMGPASEHGHRLRQVPPLRAALMLRAISQSEETPRAFYHGSSLYGYLFTRDEQILADSYQSQILRTMLFASPYIKEAIRVAWRMPDIFTREESFRIWTYALEHVEIEDSGIRMAVEVYLGLITGTLTNERIRGILDETLKIIVAPLVGSLYLTYETRRSIYPVVKYFIMHGGQEHLKVIDDYVANYLREREADEPVRRRVSPVHLAIRELTANGFKQSLVAYAETIYESKAMGQSDYSMVARLRELIGHPEFPLTDIDMQDAQHLYDPEDKGRNYVFTVYKFLMGEAFAKAVWHPGLRMWIAP